MAPIPEHGLEAGREALRRFLAGEDDLTTMLTRVILVATETVPPCDSASITMLRDGRPTTPVSTDETAVDLDAVQYDAGDGPCLAAIRHRGVEHVTTASDPRWPAFADAARRAGVRAVFSVPLGTEDSVVGGLNLYSLTSEQFDDADREVACLFADQLGVAAARAMAFAESYEVTLQLQQALESRAAIEQAKGIIMATRRCGPDEAFALLRRASQTQNRKLRAIATEIVERRSIE